MSKTCESCSKLYYEFGIEDNDEYCLDGLDINKCPEPDEGLDCPNWKEDNNG